MRAAWMVVAATLVVAGCGGGTSSRADAGSTGGVSGAGGGAAAGHGGGGAGAAGGTAGQAGGLPACAVQVRPQDPVDPTDGGFVSPTSHACNSLDPAGLWIVPEMFAWGDGGAVSDGGAPQEPAGGVILDGDYDLVRLQYPNAGGQPSRRSFRVFGGGTYIERAVMLQDPTVDGGVANVWYDTTEAPAGTDFGSHPVCGAEPASDRFSADGDTLTLFVYLHSVADPTPIGLDTYRRTCTRP